MAHHPLVRSEASSQPGPPNGPYAPEPKESSDRDLSEIAEKLAAHANGTPTADLALDLVLHEIAEQARLATTASGAAIALVRGDELVCRATSGPSAPDLGVRLTTRSGLSGACLQTGEIQRCDDASTDPRVDAEACLRLDISSILTVPLQDGDTLVGIFAIFSSRPNAFGERDVHTLQAFSARIARSIRQASGQGPITESPAPGPLPAEETAPLQSDFEIAREEPRAPIRRDLWADVLSVCIVALTLLLGWMLGRASWSRAFPNRKAVAAAASTRATSGAPPAVPQIEPSGAVAAGPAPKSPASAPPTGGMVVYENGKVIFRMAPAGMIAKETNSAQPAPRDKPAAIAVAPLTVISPEVAETLLVHRVEPEYPQEAKESRVHGDVVLTIVIGQDGTVRGITPENADPRLVSAAMDAVQQWRFKPYVKNGHETDVQTRVTLKFALP